MDRSHLRLMLVLWAAIACAPRDPPKPDPPDAAADAIESEAEPIAPVECNGQLCSEPPEGLRGNGLYACCRPDGSCGFSAGSIPGCHEISPPGSRDPACEALITRTGRALPGCCTPSGECGGLDDRTELGCIGAEDLGFDASPCTFDESIACTSATPAVCDGPEDCPDGSSCCARLGTGGYDSFACLEACFSQATSGELWFEVCHPDDGCSDPRDTCGPTDALPGFLYRCGTRPADLPDAATDPATPDAVRCGEATCTAGQDCCIRPPLEPICTDPGACRCDPSSFDGGMSTDGPVDAASADASDDGGP